MTSEFLVTVLTYGGPFLTGVIGALMPRLFDWIKTGRQENRLDHNVVVENLQTIIDRLERKQESLEEEHKTCLKESASQQKQIEFQNQEIKILWYNLKKLRQEIEEVRKNGTNDPSA